MEMAAVTAWANGGRLTVFGACGMTGLCVVMTVLTPLTCMLTWF